MCAVSDWWIEQWTLYVDTQYIHAFVSINSLYTWLTSGRILRMFAIEGKRMMNGTACKTCMRKTWMNEWWKCTHIHTKQKQKEEQNKMSKRRRHQTNQQKNYNAWANTHTDWHEYSTGNSAKSALIKPIRKHYSIHFDRFWQQISQNYSSDQLTIEFSPIPILTRSHTSFFIFLLFLFPFSLFLNFIVSSNVEMMHKHIYLLKLKISS